MIVAVNSVDGTGTVGTVINNGDDVTFIPTPGTFGPTSFKYTAIDEDDRVSNQAIVDVIVTETPVGGENIYLGVRSSQEVLRLDATSGVNFGDFVTSSDNGGLIFPSDMVFDSAGNLYVTSRDTNAILRFNAIGGHDLTIQNPLLTFPEGIAIDSSGLIYVSTANGDNIIRFDSTGAFVDVFGDDNALANPIGVVGP